MPLVSMDPCRPHRAHRYSIIPVGKFLRVYLKVTHRQEMICRVIGNSEGDVLGKGFFGLQQVTIHMHVRYASAFLNKMLFESESFR